jgi:iron-sulfur cluster assembly protein
MALDESKEDDTIFTDKDVTFMVNKDLFEQVKPIKVDFLNSPRGEGFSISSNLKNSCGSCSC